MHIVWFAVWIALPSIQQERQQNVELLEQGKRIEALTQASVDLAKEVRARMPQG